MGLAFEHAGNGLSPQHTDIETREQERRERIDKDVSIPQLPSPPLGFLRFLYYILGKD